MCVWESSDTASGNTFSPPSDIRCMVFFIGRRRYVKDGHWIRDAGVLIGKR